MLQDNLQEVVPKRRKYCGWTTICTTLKLWETKGGMISFVLSCAGFHPCTVGCLPVEFPVTQPFER